MTPENIKLYADEVIKHAGAFVLCRERMLEAEEQGVAQAVAVSPPDRECFNDEELAFRYLMIMTIGQALFVLGGIELMSRVADAVIDRNQRFGIFIENTWVGIGTQYERWD